MFKIMSKEEMFSFMDRFYPGLVKFQDDDMYLSDPFISADPLQFDNIRNHMTYKIYGKGFEFLLPEGAEGYGYLYMDYDFELPLQTSAWLFSYNINISYLADQSTTRADASGAFPTFISYNRKDIMRQATIENIIK